MIWDNLSPSLSAYPTQHSKTSIISPDCSLVNNVSSYLFCMGLVQFCMERVQFCMGLEQSCMGLVLPCMVLVQLCMGLVLGLKQIINDKARAFLNDSTCFKSQYYNFNSRGLRSKYRDIFIIKMLSRKTL